MKRVVAIATVAAAVGYLFVYLLATNYLDPVGDRTPSDRIVEAYSAVRNALFTVFFALSGSAYLVKKFVVVRMDELVYQSERYRKRYAQACKAGLRQTIDAPLRRLSMLLSLVVGATLLTSALQVTIGLVDHWVAVAICVAAVAFALTLLVIAYQIVRANLAHIRP